MYNEQKQRVWVNIQGGLQFSAGTWTYTDATNIHSQNKTAADNAPVVSFDIPMPMGRGFYGAKLEGIGVIAEVSTADLDNAPALAVYRQDYDLVDRTASATSAITATAVGMTAGTGVVVTADAQPRLWDWTVTSPAPDFTTEEKTRYIGELSIDAATTSVVKLFGIYADFTVLV